MMKDLKSQSRHGVTSPIRSITLQIRGYQVTVKVRSPLPATKVRQPVRFSVR
jgi:hypothetical protein